jgi:hypothetical protein
MTLAGGGTGRVSNHGDAPDPVTDGFTLRGVDLDEPHLHKLAEVVTKDFPAGGIHFTTCIGRRRRKNPTRTTLAALIAAVRQADGLGRADRMDCLIIEAESTTKGARKIKVELREHKVTVTAEAVNEEWISGRFDSVRTLLNDARPRLMPIIPGRAAVQIPIGALAGCGAGIGLACAAANGPNPIGTALAAVASGVVGAMAGWYSAHRARTIIRLVPKRRGRLAEPSVIGWVGIVVSIMSVAITGIGISMAHRGETPSPPSNSQRR